MHVIAASRVWDPAMLDRLREATGQDFALIDRKEDLTAERLAALAPGYVFFPHWSYLIPRAIHERFACVIFHMTDLPFGRGGSPLQNLIARGIYETKVSALRCEAGLDAGPVYLKRPLSLHGAAEEIYRRATRVIEGMIVEILRDSPQPVPQEGEPTTFARRRPEESDLAPLRELEQLFDHIRMLDAEGYPKAFLETEHFRFEFDRAALRGESVLADVRITRRQP
ncbi:Methionyl-tRNA formyltransferase [compost metagenome]